MSPTTNPNPNSVNDNTIAQTIVGIFFTFNYKVTFTFGLS